MEREQIELMCMTRGCSYERFYEHMAQEPLVQFQPTKVATLEYTSSVEQQIKLAILEYLERHPTEINLRPALTANDVPQIYEASKRKSAFS